MPWFFSFDGIDGAGKTTQIERFSDWLTELGHPVRVCRDPGSTELGERIRELLLSRSSMPLGLRAEMLLYMAARAQLVDEIIRPTLAAGGTVIADRFLLANIVYQGYAGGLDTETVRRVGAIATGDIQPTLVFVLDLDPRLAAARRGGEPDRMEQRGLEFLSRVRDGFLAEAHRWPDRVAVVDASQDPGEVQSAVQRAAGRTLAGGPP